jgi:hypothetical protein
MCLYPDVCQAEYDTHCPPRDQEPRSEKTALKQAIPSKLLKILKDEDAAQGVLEYLFDHVTGDNYGGSLTWAESRF